MLQDVVMYVLNNPTRAGLVKALARVSILRIAGARVVS